MVLLKFIWETLIPIELRTGTRWWENNGLGYLWLCNNKKILRGLQRALLRLLEQLLYSLLVGGEPLDEEGLFIKL